MWRLAIAAGIWASALLTSSALAWERHLGARQGAGQANAIALNADGDVFAVGDLFARRRGRLSGGLGVTRLRGATGAVLWKRILNGGAHAVVLDPAGDALVAAARRRPRRPSDFMVVKLAGGGGRIRWRQHILLGAAFGVATDAHGDVVAAGGLGLDHEQWIVTKLARATGAEEWRQTLPGTSIASSTAFTIAVDAGGDVFVAGRTMDGPDTTALTVMKLRSADGIPIWRHDLNPGPAGTSSTGGVLRIDPAGDVIVAGAVEHRVSPLQARFTVVKLAGPSGTELWRQVLSEPGRYGFPTGVAVDQHGDLLAVGGLPQPGSTGSDFAAIKLDGRDGGELWRVTIDGSGHVDDGAQAVAVDPAGNFAVAGFLQDPDSGVDFVVVRLRGVDGTELSRSVIANGGGDIAFAVAVDRMGRIIAAGTTNCSDRPG